MSASWKGSLQVVLISEEPSYIAEDGSKWIERVWAGRKDAIIGYANELQENGLSYNVVKGEGPVYLVSARIPVNEPTEVIALDRYEITTEAQDKSIFEVPEIIIDAARHDGLLPKKSYRQFAEDFVGAPQTTSPALIGDEVGRFDSVVRHLRNGATGFQIDFLTLRRYRQIDQVYAYGAGKMSLSDGLVIYSTGQLNLPANVAFSLPSTPSAPSSDFAWGWRLRGQRVEIVGNYAEQVMELVFAPWSTLAYTPAVGNLNW